jgi:uncharacterized membrane protein
MSSLTGPLTTPAPEPADPADPLASDPADRAAPLPAEPSEPATPLPVDPVARPWWQPPSLPGAWAAVLFVCMSLTPSLLPRTAASQGLISGISAAIGYGLGVAAAAVWRAFADREERPARATSWRLFAIVGGGALVVALVLGRRWQDQIRALMGVDGRPLWQLVLAPLVAMGVFALLLGTARFLRRATRWTRVRLERRIGPKAAGTLAWVLVAWLAFLLVTGVLFDAVLGTLDGIFSVRDGSTDEGVEPPTSALRAGSPDSLIAWETLGRQGRNFVTRGSSAAEIEAFTGEAASEPIRIYSGMASADEAERRAQLAVDDLERAGGFERGHLVVATTTGTGWMPPGTIDAYEHVTGGDSAIVALQYSYLPSWLSYLVDQPRAREAGRELFDAVYARWEALPAAERPRLYVFGESLGSFGGEAAFSGEFDLRNRTDGALFTGPPSFNTLHREFTANRDPGSPQVEPVFRGGRTVRFSADVDAGFPPEGDPWEDSRVIYLQHASDPVVYWHRDLLFERPDWLREPPGRDVLDEMVWFPFVTFWQVTMDFPFAVAVPAGHGHVYVQESVDAWVAITQPSNWTPGDTQRLRELVGED